MKKLFIFLLPFFIALFIVIVVVLFLKGRSGKGALQVTSQPSSSVYLNGKLIGKTPLCKCESSEMLATGDYTIKLQPDDSSLAPFEDKIKIGKSVLTVVDRTFGQGSFSEGSVITLAPSDNPSSAQLLVISFPSGVHLFLDGNQTADTPALLKNIAISDHEIRLQKDGYKDKTLQIRGVEGYKLTAEIFLSINPDFPNQNSSPSAPLSGVNNATSSAGLSATPTVAKVEILQTPTGYLNVRLDSSINSSIIGKVNPGEVYQLLDEVTGWYKIQVTKDQTGWISNQYAQKR